MLNFKITTGPESEPVSLAEAKAHIRETSGDQDALITGLIQSAREYAETVTGLKLMEQTITAVCDSFPRAGGNIALPVGPVLSVTSLTYTDEDGTEETFNGFTLDNYDTPPKLVLNPGESWPGVTLHTANPVKITYLAGFSSASAVPAKLKQAILLLVGHWFENREEVITGIESFTVPVAAETLLQSARHIYT
jgi:uncharacterized phiE125 gp8 family phage protein